VVLNRRDLLKGGMLAAGAAALPRVSEAASGGDELKFCVFADIHYYKDRFVNSEIGFLQRILDRAANPRELISPWRTTPCMTDLDDGS